MGEWNYGMRGDGTVQVPWRDFYALTQVLSAAMEWKIAHGVLHIPDYDSIPYGAGDPFTTARMAETSNDLAGALDAWSDTTRIPSIPPQCASKPSNPSDTHDPPSVGNLESVSPQSEQVEADKGEG